MVVIYHQLPGVSKTPIVNQTQCVESEEHVIEVPAELAGQRVDRAAARLFSGYSRAVLTRWIRRGALTVDGQTTDPDRRMQGGERLTLTLDAEHRVTDSPAEDWAVPQPVDFSIIHEDEHCLVVDKPAGIAVHPGAGNRDGTLVNGLLKHRPELGRLPRAGIVHRIDMNTSGLLVVAASPTAQRRLAGAIAAHSVDRRYIGVAEGEMIAGCDIDKPIGRDRRNRTRQQVRADGRPAVTRVRVRERYRAHTAFEARLETGRTHQIRVHMASIGHPLVGDRSYGARGLLPRAPHPAVILALRGFARQALHAAALEFDHPDTGDRCRFEAPLPRDLAELVAVLRQDRDSHG